MRQKKDKELKELQIQVFAIKNESQSVQLAAIKAEMAKFAQHQAHEANNKSKAAEDLLNFEEEYRNARRRSRFLDEDENEDELGPDGNPLHFKPVATASKKQLNKAKAEELQKYIQEREEQNIAIMKELDKLQQLLEACHSQQMSPAPQTGAAKQDFQFLRELLEAVAQFVVDDETAARICNIGIMDVLLSMLQQLEKDPPEKQELVTGALRHVTRFKKQLAISTKQINFLSFVMPFLQFLSSKSNSTGPSQQACIYHLELLKNLCQIDSFVEKIIDAKGQGMIYQIFKIPGASVNVLIGCCQIFEIIAQNDFFVQKIITDDMINYLAELYGKNIQNKTFIQVIGNFVGVVSRNQTTQEKLGKINFHKQIIHGLEIHAASKDIELLTNSF